MALQHARLGDLAGGEVARASLEGHRFEKHSHDEFVISANLQGAEDIWLDGRSFNAGPGDLTLYNPGQIQGGGAAQGQPWCFVSLYLPETTLAAVLGVSAVACDRPLLHAPALAQALALSVERCLSTDALVRERGEECLTLTLGNLLRETGGPPLHSAALGRRPVARLQEWLAANLAESLSLERMAEEVAVSRFHLLRAFKQETGLSPRQWAMQLRTRRALGLLRAGWAVGEIAHALGFADQSHFTRHFRNAYGLSPGRYPRAIRG
ncbi:MAG: Multiple antibiotic resistance protein MarA [Pseudomonas delhiensis]|nr:MAG: Multiple antibiotic resistance protein MarA [Pseudomonas delhiensis]